MVAFQGVLWAGPACVRFGAEGRCKRAATVVIPQTPQLVASALSRLRIHALVSPTSVMGPGDTCLLCVELFVLLAASP